MDIDLLREFAVLAQSETFLKAADLLFISQPTLSRHIKNLEAELGVSLFERTTRSSKLTKAGHLLLPYAQQIVELYQKFSNDLAEEKKEQHSILRLGSIAAMDSYGITEMIARYKELYPQAKTNLAPHYNISFTEMLHNRNCDLAFIREFDVNPDDGIGRLTVAEDHLAIVVPANDPLANRQSVFIPDLKGRDVISLPEETSIWQAFQNACEKEGLPADPILTHHSVEHLFNCAKLGIGIAVLTRRLIEPEWLRSGEAVVLDIEPVRTHSVNLCWSKSVRLSEAALNFIDMFRKEFQQEA